MRDDLNKIKDKQARMEGKVKDIKTELVECIETRCKRQDGLLQEQREKIRSLEADRDQASPERPTEVGWSSDVTGYMPSWGWAETSGSLGLIQAPSMIVPECMQNASGRAWGSTQDGAGAHRPRHG